MLSRSFKIRRVHREQAAEHHRLHFLVARQRLCRAALHGGDGVTDAGLLHLLDLGGDEADFAGAKLTQIGAFRREAADPVNQMLRPALHEADVEPW